MRNFLDLDKKQGIEVVLTADCTINGSFMNILAYGADDIVD